MHKRLWSISGPLTRRWLVEAFGWDQYRSAEGGTEIVVMAVMHRAMGATFISVTSALLFQPLIIGPKGAALLLYTFLPQLLSNTTQKYTQLKMSNYK